MVAVECLLAVCLVAECLVECLAAGWATTKQFSPFSFFIVFSPILMTVLIIIKPLEGLRCMTIKPAGKNGLNSIMMQCNLLQSNKIIDEYRTKKET